VYSVFIQPKEGVIPKVLAYLWPTVVRPCIAPRRVRAIVIIEIDTAVVIPVAPAVETPEIEVARAEVIVNHVHDHRDALSMRSFHEPVEALWAAQPRFHGEGVRR